MMNFLYHTFISGNMSVTLYKIILIPNSRKYMVFYFGMSMKYSNFA